MLSPGDEREHDIIRDLVKPIVAEAQEITGSLARSETGD